MATVTLWDERHYRHGDAHHGARYSSDLVELARQLDDDGAPRPAIARRIGVPYHTLRDWLDYRTRIHE